jgi:hypothetical protein
MGWWWQPKMSFGFTAKAAGVFQETFVLMFVALGPQLRYFVSQHWAVTGMAGFGLTQGLSRVPQTNVPRPPSSAELGARRGIIGQAQLAYFFWPKKSHAFAPTLTFMAGSQSERSFSAIALGLTYQSGRPKYDGDVTSTW